MPRRSIRSIFNRQSVFKAIPPGPTNCPSCGSPLEFLAIDSRITHAHAQPCGCCISIEMFQELLAGE